jgi:hypothetical protein
MWKPDIKVQALLFDIDHTLLVPIGKMVAKNTPLYNTALEKDDLLAHLLKQRYGARLLKYETLEGKMVRYVLLPHWLELLALAFKKWNFTILLFSGGQERRSQWLANELKLLLRKKKNLEVDMGVVPSSCLVEGNPIVAGLQKCKSVSAAYSLSHSLLVDDNLMFVLKDEWPQLIFHTSSLELFLYEEIYHLGSFSYEYLQFLKQTNNPGTFDSRKLYNIPFYVAGILFYCHKKMVKHKDWTIRKAFQQVYARPPDLNPEKWIKKGKRVLGMITSSEHKAK